MPAGGHAHTAQTCLSSVNISPRVRDRLYQNARVSSARRVAGLFPHLHAFRAVSHGHPVATVIVTYRNFLKRVILLDTLGVCPRVILFHPL